MNLLERVITLFGLCSNLCSISERMKILEVSALCKGGQLPAESEIVSMLSLFPHQDKVKITMRNVLDSYLVITSYSMDPIKRNTFWEELEEDDDIEISISIEKTISNNTLSIYSFDSFVEELRKLDILELLHSFGVLLNNRENLIFNVYDSNISLSTKSMLFRNEGQSITIADFERLERVELCKQASCFYNITEYPLLPEDFSLVVDYGENPFKDIFNQLKCLLSIVYLSTTAVIRNNDLQVQITGQRNISYKYDVLNTQFYNEELYKIYSWIFIGGNAVDKAIIARNIISLHCKYTDLLSTDEKTFASIQTNYGLYQKENVSQYIDLKNKLSEFILEITNETSSIVIGMAEKIKNNLLGIFSFIFSVIIINSVSSNPLDSIFTKDITFLVEAILAGSVVYMVFSIQEVNYAIKKLKTGYNSLKENYSEILDDVDKQNIFNDDNVIEENISEVNKKKKVYIFVWLIMITLGFIAIENISNYPIIKKICVIIYEYLCK